MQIPDRELVRKCKEYDPALYFIWNNQTQWFELWRKMENGRHVCVTTVTQSIYDTRKPRAFIELDERLLWWIYEADSWRTGGSKKHSLAHDTRWLEWQKTVDRRLMRDHYDRAKDVWSFANAFYATRPPSKNGPPQFNHHAPTTKWINPDVQARNSRRLFSRSKNNALAYNYRAK